MVCGHFVTGDWGLVFWVTRALEIPLATAPVSHPISTTAYNSPILQAATKNSKEETPIKSDSLSRALRSLPTGSMPKCRVLIGRRLSRISGI